jgi:cytoskeleton protein RodZ
VSEAGPEVGAALQRAREARGLALSEVAQQLKFAARQLEALEQDRFDLLPGGTFARGMVRNYARLLKIDPEPLVRSIAERYEAPDANQLAARYRQPVPFSDSARRSTFVYLGLSLGVLALGAGVAWQWYHERGKGRSAARAAPAVEVAKPAPEAPAARPPEKKVEPRRVAAAPNPKAAPAAAKAAPVAAAPAQAAVAKAEPQKTEAESEASAQPLPVVNVAPGVHRLVIHCEEEAWIEVRDSKERALVSSLNPAGAERIVQARGPLTLTIGNAQHVRILRNDQPIDLAPYTKVETARFVLP